MKEDTKTPKELTKTPEVKEASHLLQLGSVFTKRNASIKHRPKTQDSSDPISIHLIQQTKWET